MGKPAFLAAGKAIPAARVQPACPMVPLLGDNARDTPPPPVTGLLGGKIIASTTYYACVRFSF